MKVQILSAEAGRGNHAGKAHGRLSTGRSTQTVGRINPYNERILEIARTADHFPIGRLGYARKSPSRLMPEVKSTSWFNALAESPAVRRLSAMIGAATPGAGEAISARGAIGSSTTLVAAALHQQLKRPVLLMVAHLDEADEAVDVVPADDGPVETSAVLRAALRHLGRS